MFDFINMLSLEALCCWCKNKQAWTDDMFFNQETRDETFVYIRVATVGYF